MASANQAILHSRVTAVDRASMDVSSDSAKAFELSEPIRFVVNHDLRAVEREWRLFQQYADCTAFQCFDWLEAWQRNVGSLAGVTPAVVIGRDSAGQTLLILPLAVSKSHLVRTLTFLGRDLCDYNAPLLAPGFDQFCGERFPDFWHQVKALLQAERRWQFDLALLDKMPEQVGAQRNPFLQLPLTLNPSGAYRASLSGDWDSFYGAKRSAATRRRDRSKRRRLSEYGPTQLVTAQSPDEAAHTLELLIDQKRRAFARMGVPDLFNRPGYIAFFRDLATRPEVDRMVHVSRLDVGSAPAATNLGLEFRGAYYHVLASYADGPMARFGPGAAHLQDLMRRALERGDTVFDFTIGDEPYKRDWSDTTLHLYDLVAAHNSRGVAVASMLTAARSVKRSVKQSRLWPLALRLRSALAGSKEQRSAKDQGE